MITSNTYPIKNIYIINFLVIFSGTFLVGLNKYFSPIYVIFIFSFVLFCINILQKKTIQYDSFRILLYSVLPILLILLIQNNYLGLKYGIVNEIGRHIVPLLYISILYFVINNKVINIKLLCQYFIKFNMLLLIVELFYRIMLSIKYNGITFQYYSYKFESLIYPDSNFVGLHILSLYFFIKIYAKHYNLKYEKLYYILSIALLIFAFSRTAYLIFIFYLIIKIISKYKKSIFRFFITIIFLSIIIIVSFDVISDILDDGSFKTKLYIFNEFMNIFFLNISIFTILFGVGAGNLVDIIGRESHNLFGLIFEMGFIWLIVYIYTLYILIGKISKNAFLFLLPIIISGLFSLLPLAYMSFYYVGLLLIRKLNVRN